MGQWKSLCTQTVEGQEAGGGEERGRHSQPQARAEGGRDVLGGAGTSVSGAASLSLGPAWQDLELQKSQPSFAFQFSLWNGPRFLCTCLFHNQHNQYIFILKKKNG